MANISPPMRRHHPPRFYEISPAEFEELCCDLFEVQPGIRQCKRYGTDRQNQRGIDLHALRQENDGIEVAQCKRYKQVTVKLLEDATDRFFEDWDYWSQKNVRRFILFVANEAKRTEIIEARDKQAARFQKKGITYELWDSRDIARHLGPHRAIVERYLDPPWPDIICGVPPATRLTAPAAAIISSSDLGALLAHLSGQANQQLEAALQTWREGQRDEAEQMLAALRADDVRWHALAPEVQAKILQYQGRLALDKGQSDQARALHAEAAALAGVPDPNLGTLLRFHDEGAEAALAWLEDQGVSVPNLRAGLQLQLGRPEEALQTLAARSAHEADAETYRLRALAYLAQGNLGDAIHAIGQALQQQPHWVSVRNVAAMLDYFSALSPAARPTYLVAWPIPVDWALVGRDDASLAALDRAATRFEELAEQAADPDERRRLLLWRGASLANHPDRQVDAQALYAQLLADDPTDYRAFIWALARGMPFDYRPSTRAMGQLVGAGTAEVPHVQALLNYRLLNDEWADARKLLNQTRALFRQAGEQVEWAVWHQALLAIANPRAALPAHDPRTATPDGRHATIRALGTRARATNDWEPLLEYLQGCYEATGDAIFLLGLCELLAQEQRWPEAARHASGLVDRMQTSEALRLAAISCYQARQYPESLALLDSHRHLFREGQLPPDLQRVRLRALRALGQPQAALLQAQELSLVDSSTENLLEIIDLHAEMGDLEQASVVARGVLGRTDLTAEQALRAGWLVRLVSQQQAADFLRHAAATGVADDWVGQAVGLAHELGLDAADATLRNLMARLMELGQTGQGGIRALTIEETRTLLRQMHEGQVEMEELYRHGQTPIHLIARYVRGEMADWHHGMLTSNATHHPGDGPTLLVRHGSRAAATEPPQTPAAIRLHMDLTALLLAAHFGVLDLVEEVFQPIRLPHTTQGALIELMDALQHHQPEQLLHQQQVADLAQRGVLHLLLLSPADDWQAALREKATADEAWLVTFLSVEESASKRMLGGRDLLETLRIAGAIAAGDYSRALEALGLEVENQTGERPLHGSTLYCTPGMATMLADMGVLDAASRHFRIHLLQAELNQNEQALRANARREDASRWVDLLRERVRRGLEGGIYQSIPLAEAPDDIETREERLTSIEVGLLILASYATEPGDVIWADDRFLTRGKRRDEAAIVGLFDVLVWLAKWGNLEQHQYYDLLHRMRAANLRHLPLSTEDILHHLLVAPVQDGEVTETLELQVLRRYLAAGLTIGGILQPPTSPDHPGETDWVLSSQRAVVDALASLWQGEEADEEARTARATWLLDNLYYDMAHLRALLDLPSEQADGAYLAALDLSTFITAVFRLPGWKRERQRGYTAWLDQYVIQPRMRAMPELRAAVVDFLKTLFASVGEEAEDDLRGAMLAYSLARLPHSLEQALVTDSDWAATVGLPVVEVLGVSGMQFPAREFWRAVAGALAGETSTLSEMTTGRSVTFQPKPEAHRAVFFYTEQPQARVFVDEAFQALLVPDVEARRQFLHQRRAWFVGDDAEFEGAVGEIVSIEEPNDRIDAALTRWQRSVSYFYRTLEARLVHGDKRTEEDLLPPPEGVLHYLSLSEWCEAEAWGGAAYEAAARQLLEEVGLAEALQRLWGLPVPLSAALLEATHALSAEEWRLLVRQLLRAACTPLAQMHLLRLLLQGGHPAPAYERLAARLARGLLGEGGLEGIVALSHLALWTLARLSERTEAGRWPLAARLAVAWYHAHRLYDLERRAGYHAAHLADALMDRLHVWSEVLRAAEESDLAHPHLNEPAALLVGGLNLVLEGWEDGRARAWLDRLPSVSEGWRTVLKAWWFYDAGRLPNRLDTFLAQSREAVWSALLAPDLVTTSRSLDQQQAASQTLAMLAENPADEQAWLALRMLLGWEPVDEPWLTPLAEAARNLELPGEVNVMRDSFILRVAASLLRAARDSSLQEHLTSQLGSLAERLHEENVALLHEEVMGLLDVALRISLLAPSPSEIHASLARLLKRLGEVPSITPYAKMQVITQRTSLAPDEARWYDEVLAYLRRL